MPSQLRIAAAVFLALVPVTLLVPGAHELVAARGGNASDAHAFMVVNMIAGMIAVPVVMRLMRSGGNVKRWLVVALVVDAVAFLGMGLSESMGALYAFRVLDGAAHLPAVTLLMLASHRVTRERSGGAMGLLASSIMIGVAVGSPLGGWLVEHDVPLPYWTGGVLLAGAALVSSTLRNVPADHASARPSGRYAWKRDSLATWIPLAYGFLDRFAIGIFVSTFTLFLRQVHSVGATERGVLIALFMLPFALLCYPTGRLADRRGWFTLMIVGNAAFGVLFAAYGIVPPAYLPLAMIASGVASACIYAPNLLLISTLVRGGAGEGLFGAFQVAGALGFLVGPIVGGLLVAVTRDASGVPAFRMIFSMVGALEIALAMVAFSVLRHVAWRQAPRGQSRFRAATA